MKKENEKAKVPSNENKKSKFKGIPHNPSKFKKLEKLKLYNPVDWYNRFGPFLSAFEGTKFAHFIISENEIAFTDFESQNMKTATFKLNPAGFVSVLKDNPYDIDKGLEITKFMLLSACRFSGDNLAAMSYVDYTLRKMEIPFIRVGSDYFKSIEKVDRWGGKSQQLKDWKKNEIKQDHGNSFLKHIYKYNDFTMIPDNKVFTPVKDSCYNLYSKFPHEVHPHEVSMEEIPFTIGFIRHIFGEQFDLGLKYMKVLYEHPKQILPILVLISKERETGKTTFLNLILMIFGENATIISPSNLTGDFNSLFAHKNIIVIDETVIEKSASIEKIKSIATAKILAVNKKYISEYSVPFFGKIILCTNKEKDFMRIDQEEVRFWVRKINPIDPTSLNTNLEDDLFNEIPKFLRYLSQLPDIDFSKSRMVFTKEEISNDFLTNVKTESRSGLLKDLEILIEEVFNTIAPDVFYATAIDIKNKWFNNNNQISFSYIRKVLKEEMKLNVEINQRYSPFEENSITTKVGTPFKFVRKPKGGTVL